MDDFLGLASFLKMTGGAAAVALAGALADGGGPLLAAMVMTLPTAATVSFIFLALDHSAAFISDAALGAVVMNAANAFWVVAYVLLARRLGATIAFVAALCCWAGVNVALLSIDWMLGSASLLAAMTYAAAFVIVRGYAHPQAAATARRIWWDLPVRMFVAAAVVGLTLVAAALLGPVASGMASAVPVSLTIATLFIQRRLGSATASSIAVMALPGLLGFAVAGVIVSIASEQVGKWPALTLGLVICLAWNAFFALRGRVRAPS